MASVSTNDKSNGYEEMEEMAEHFMASRNPNIGVANIRSWSRARSTGSSVLDLGCGNGIPISKVLIEEGLDVYGVDASEKMICAFCSEFPHAHAVCAAVEDSDLYQREFDAVLAWGLFFLLAPELQRHVMRKVAKALKPQGKFLFTAPTQVLTWKDALTGRESFSLGRDGYLQLLKENGLVLNGEQTDEGDNHYYLSSKA
jgi:2-polyprenyl-3-methyl-5-hydroxy-6-metoxy-1,4-benzoquinol methylase